LSKLLFLIIRLFQTQIGPEKMKLKRGKTWEKNEK